MCILDRIWGPQYKEVFLGGSHPRHTFNPFLCCLSPFKLSYVAVSRPSCLSKLYPNKASVNYIVMGILFYKCHIILKFRTLQDSNFASPISYYLELQNCRSTFKNGSWRNYSQTLYGHLLKTDTPLLRTVFIVPGESSYIFSKFKLLNTDVG